jgi:hypothetical protein
MSGRSWLWVVAIASIGVFLVAPFVTPDPDLAAVLVFGASATSSVIVGMVLIARAPGNRVGPLLLLAGTLLALGYAFGLYADAGAAAAPPWPGVGLLSVLGDSLFVYPIVIVLVGIPLIFPDGRLISPRWRAVVWLVVAAMAAQTVASLTSASSSIEGFDNPLAVPGLQSVDAILDGFSSATSVIGFGAAAAALWVRYRRGSPLERQQLRWLLAVAALAAVFLPAAFIVPDQDIANVAFILGALTLVALPITIAVAILRYRLYEIDRIISRTIAYTIVSLVLFGVFGVGVLLLSAALASFASGQTVAVAGATLIAYALFQPVLRRIRREVDRRFDRARYDGDRTAAAFSQRLRDETDLDAVTSDLSTTIRAALAPAALGVWIRNGGRW